MRDDELRNLLRERNPWWRAAASGNDPTAWAAGDPTLQAAEMTGIDHHPGILDDVDPNGGLWVLRGPRRVGKSVAVKRLALRFCRDENPWRLIYFAADTLRPQDLRRAFTLGRDITAAAGSSPRLWLVDEVTSVVGWEQVVKELRDNTALAGDGVVLTGSSASRLEEAVRSLGAGRTNVADPFRLLLPMTFREVLTATEAEIPLPEPVSPDALQGESARDVAMSLVAFTDELDLAWQRYLETGGFPRAVGDSYRSGEVSRAFVQDLQAWLSADVTWGEPAESATGLLFVLHQRMTSPLDVTETAGALHTTRDKLRIRLERLTGTFAAFWCHQSDSAGHRVSHSQSKLYLIDPLLARVPNLLDETVSPPDLTRSTEAMLGLALARSVTALHPERFLEQRAVTYTRTGSGGEVDFAPAFVSVGGSRLSTCPIESKWSPGGWKSGARTTRGKYGRGVVATKNTTDITGDVWALPAPVVALLLNPLR